MESQFIARRWFDGQLDRISAWPTDHFYIMYSFCDARMVFYVRLGDTDTVRRQGQMKEGGSPR